VCITDSSAYVKAIFQFSRDLVDTAVTATVNLPFKSTTLALFLAVNHTLDITTVKYCKHKVLQNIKENLKVHCMLDERFI
jgi:hypothetical protein